MTFYTNYPNNQEYVINRILNKIENNTEGNNIDENNETL